MLPFISYFKSKPETAAQNKFHVKSIGVYFSKLRCINRIVMLASKVPIDFLQINFIFRERNTLRAIKNYNSWNISSFVNCFSRQQALTCSSIREFVKRSQKLSEPPKELHLTNSMLKHETSFLIYLNGFVCIFLLKRRSKST